MAQKFFELELNDCDSLKNWNYLGDTENLGINYTGQVQGTACVVFDFNDVATNTGGVYNSTIGVKNITNFDEVRLNFFCASANFSVLSSGQARVGTDANNYYYWNLTPAQMTAVANTTAQDGWREIVLSNLSGASTSGTVDNNNINYLSLRVVRNSAYEFSDMRIDNWRAIRYFQNEHDVELDGQGYQLLQQEGSYNRGNQPYSVDRYSTGDITYSNFDTYQYKAQTDWSGGWNDDFGIGGNTFWDGKGIDVSEIGRIQNLPAMSSIGTVANTGVVTAIQEYKQSAFFGVSAGTASARIYSWPGTGTTLTLQHTVARSAILDMTVYQGRLWASVGQPQRTDASLINFDGGWSAIAQSGIYFGQISDTLYVAGAEGLMRSFDGTTWTTEFQQTGWEIHRMVAWRDKLWYLASLGHWKYWGQVKSALYSYDGTDRLLIQDFDDWCKPSIEVYNNKLQFVIGGVLKEFDGENITDALDITSRYPKELALDTYSSSTDLYDASDFGKGIQAVGKRLFVLQNSASATTTTTVLINEGNGFVPGFYGSSSVSSTFFTALGAYTKNKVKRLLAGTNNGVVTYQPIDDDGTDYRTAYWDSSWIDADLFSVDKIFKSIQIFYDPISSTSENITVQYIIDNEDDTFTTLNVVNSLYESGSTFSEFEFPPDTVGKKLRYRIILGGDVATDNHDPSTKIKVTDVAVKYLLAPDTKRKWNIKVVMPNNLQLNSGFRDTSNGETLANTLWDSRVKKEVLQYKDIDNQIYNVIINDVQIQGPYNIQTGRDSRGTNPEYVASIELLEG